MSGRRFPAGRAPQSAAQPVRWAEAIAELRGAALRLRAGERLDQVSEHILAGQVRRCAAAEIPVEGESAREAKKAFVALGRGMALSAGERRVAFAVALVAACELLEALLEESRRKAAAGWQRQFTD